jgi:hypothetical protein
LGPQDRQNANELLAEHARRLYGKTLDQLNAGQLREVGALVYKEHFTC